MNSFTTSEIASYAKIHPNTVRLYEELGLIPKAERKANGYRVFTDLHMEQIKLVRMALKIEILQNGLRKQAITIIKTAAAGHFGEAILLTEFYLQQICQEQKNADEAIAITRKLLSGSTGELTDTFYTRKQTADYLQISIDALRNWEMNGLLTVKRKQNGYRIYMAEDIRRLKIIRALRCANYSLAAILRMLNSLSKNPEADIDQVIDTPCEDDDIISVCDKLRTSLSYAGQNAQAMLAHLKEMQKQFTPNSPL